MIALLYRRITAVGKLTVVLWIGMLVTVLWIIASGLAQLPRRAWPSIFRRTRSRFSTGFVAGLGSAMLIAMYDFMGYYDICYVGGEVRNPARVIPRSIIYLRPGRGGDLCADEPEHHRRGAVARSHAVEVHRRRSSSRGSTEPRAASAVTVLVLWTAFASVFALLFGLQPHSLRGRRQRPLLQRLRAGCIPTGRFPHVSLLVIGGLSIVASLCGISTR